MYLCHNNPRFSETSLPESVVQMCGIRKLLTDGVGLSNGDVIFVDALVFCTGYHYSFPFLSPECEVEVTAGNFVTPLYKHMIHARYPTMSFIGIPKVVVPFPMFDRQAQFIVALLLSVEPTLIPGIREMESEVRKEVEEWSSGDKSRKDFHEMQFTQWEYNDWLAAVGGFQPLPAVLCRLFQHVRSRRHVDFKSYKSVNYKIIDDSSFVEVN